MSWEAPQPLTARGRSSCPSLPCPVGTQSGTPGTWGGAPRPSPLSLSPSTRPRALGPLKSWGKTLCPAHVLLSYSPRPWLVTNPTSFLRTLPVWFQAQVQCTTRIVPKPCSELPWVSSGMTGAVGSPAWCSDTGESQGAPRRPVCLPRRPVCLPHTVSSGLSLVVRELAQSRHFNLGESALLRGSFPILNCWTHGRLRNP